MLTPDELRQIRRLQLQAGRRVDSLFSGSYRSAFKGRGMEFEEVRPYVPGDDVRRIDWNVTARAGSPFIKEFKEERQITLVIVTDVSGSVGFGSGGFDGKTDKALQQARIGAALAHAAIRSSDKVGLVTFGSEVLSYLPPRRSKAHIWRVIRTVFEETPANSETNIEELALFLGKVLKRRAVICLLSDFIDPGKWDLPLASLARKHKIHSFLVHDPVESDFPKVGLIELEDAETGSSVLVDASQLHSIISVESRLSRLRKCGVYSTAISTSQDPFDALVSHFQRVGRQR